MAISIKLNNAATKLYLWHLLQKFKTTTLHIVFKLLNPLAHSTPQSWHFWGAESPVVCVMACTLRSNFLMHWLEWREGVPTWLPELTGIFVLLSILLASLHTTFPSMTHWWRWGLTYILLANLCKTLSHCLFTVCQPFFHKYTWFCEYW